jgi:hypothetical protein
MSDLVARKLPLRHPAENPTFILMVVLNFAILAVLIDFLTTVAFDSSFVARHELGGCDPRGRGGDNPGGSGDHGRPSGAASIDPRDGRAAIPDSVPGHVRLG